MAGFAPDSGRFEAIFDRFRKFVNGAAQCWPAPALAVSLSPAKLFLGPHDLSLFKLLLIALPFEALEDIGACLQRKADHNRVCLDDGIAPKGGQLNSGSLLRRCALTHTDETPGR